MKPPGLVVWAFLVASVAGALTYALVSRDRPAAPAVSVVGNLPRDRCRRCHENEYTQWAKTPHARHATARAEPPGGAALAIGSVWMQAYFRRDQAGRHRIVDKCVDLRTGQWRDVGAVLQEIAGLGRAGTAAYGASLAGRSFERDCAGCHASGVAVAFDLDQQRLVGGWRDAAIDCEACHGNGDEHVRLGGAKGSIASLASLTPRAQTAVCGRCHGGPPTTGDLAPEDAADWLPVLVDHDGLYENGEAAGQGYQIGPFVRSGCYRQGGLTCTSCHGAHDTALAESGNSDSLCLSCHVAQGAASHTHHAPDSPGSRCIACHMPRLRTGIVAHQRTHHIGVPLPALTDIPDACTTCHADHPRAWSDSAWRRWWGTPPQLTLDAVATIRAARARVGGTRAGEDAQRQLERLQRHPDPFFRAASIQYAGPTRQILIDPDPAVRLAAARAAAHRGDLAYLRRALNDSEARIRGEAAVVLFGAGERIPTRHWNDVKVTSDQVGGNVSAHLLDALRNAGLGEDDTARRIFGDLSARTPDDPRVWMAWAEFEFDRDFNQRARSALEQGLAVWKRRETPGRSGWQDLDRYVAVAVERGKLRWARALLSAYTRHLPHPEIAARVRAIQKRFVATFGIGGS